MAFYIRNSLVFLIAPYLACRYAQLTGSVIAGSAHAATPGVWGLARLWGSWAGVWGLALGLAHTPAPSGGSGVISDPPRSQCILSSRAGLRDANHAGAAHVWEVSGCRWPSQGWKNGGNPPSSHWLPESIAIMLLFSTAVVATGQAAQTGHMESHHVSLRCPDICV